MNLDDARAIAETALYEGYVLYPYRASATKNHSRWQFGVVMADSYAALDPTESSVSQTECVLEYTDASTVQVVVRFLQVQRRTVEARSPGSVGYLPVDVLTVADTLVAGWDEAVPVEYSFRVSVARLLSAGHAEDVRVDGGRETETVRDERGDVVGRLVRVRQPLRAFVSCSAAEVPGPWQALRLRVRVENRSTPTPVPTRRDAALPTALVAVHTILGAEAGLFLSMLDSPEWARPAVSACENLGTWPVLAGHAGRRDVVLSSPIILPDHPALAPESTSDLYDATEIDEILLLRTLALTDAEKREARATDPRAAAVIDRADALDGPTVERLHGAIRYLRDVTGGPPDEPDPLAALMRLSADETVKVGGVLLSAGSAVRLRPGIRRADAQDMFLTGRLATVAAVLRDVDDQPYLAVTLVDDPGADLQHAHGRYLYFSPDEVEPA